MALDRDPTKLRTLLLEEGILKTSVDKNRLAAEILSGAMVTFEEATYGRGEWITSDDETLDVKKMDWKDSKATMTVEVTPLEGDPYTVSVTLTAKVS